MATRLPRILGPDLLPRVANTEAAQAQIASLGPEIDGLRSDVEAYDTLTDRARLARHLIRRAEFELLTGQAVQAPQDLEEAARLFARDEREAPLMLVAARQAWAETLLGHPERAVEVLVRVLAVDDVTVRAWEEQFCLWLAAAYLARGQVDHAQAMVQRGAEVLKANPRKDPALVREAMRRLGIDEEG